MECGEFVFEQLSVLRRSRKNVSSLGKIRFRFRFRFRLELELELELSFFFITVHLCVYVLYNYLLYPSRRVKSKVYLSFYLPLSRFILSIYPFIYEGFVLSFPLSTAPPIPFLAI